MFGRSGRPNLRRALAAIAVAGLALALFATVRPTNDAHAATVCTRHTKRIVKHVKRHGRRHRVVRIRHYWTCEEAPSPDPPTGSSPTAPTSPTPSPTEPQPEANALGVVARDDGHRYRYEPSRTTVRSGRLTVQLNNQGEDPHNMDMQRIGPGGEGEGEVIAMPLTAPKNQSTKSVQVQPGTYRMWCTLANHAEEGMEMTITVE